MAQRWNGREWRLAALTKTNTMSFTDVLTFSRNTVWVVGYRLTPNEAAILKWNGSRLRLVASADPGTGESRLYGIGGTSSGDIWAVGAKNMVDNAEGDPFIQRWDGNSWTETPAEDPGPASARLMAVSAVTQNDAWAFGNYGGETLVEHWNGVAWTIVPSPNPENGDRGTWDIAAIASDDVWAVGSSWPGGFGTSDPMALHWTGSSFAETVSPQPEDSTGLHGVDGLTGDDVWAVGSAGYPFGGTLVQNWDGATWTQVSAPSPPASSLSGIDVIAPGSAWAVGRMRAATSARSLILSACGI